VASGGSHSVSEGDPPTLVGWGGLAAGARRPRGVLAPPEPSADERAEQALVALQQQYVDGGLTEAEFERRVVRLVTNHSIDEACAARERRRAIDADAERTVSGR